MRSPATEGFQRGRRELGYVEGQTIIVEWWLAEGRFERLSAALSFGRAAVGGADAVSPRAGGTQNVLWTSYVLSMSEVFVALRARKDVRTWIRTFC